MLDLTSAVRSGPELVIELRVRGGNVELVLAPGMVVDANELAVRFTRLAISRDAGDNTPETLRVRLRTAGCGTPRSFDTRWPRAAPGRAAYCSTTRHRSLGKPGTSPVPRCTTSAHRPSRVISGL